MKKKVTIYHNPRCSKSRAAIDYLQQQNISVSVVEYLKEAPTEEEIQSILEKLNLTAREVLRTSEPQYKSLNLTGSDHSETELVGLMHRHPILIERPIVVTEHNAAIGRPLTNIIEMLEDEDD